MPDLTAASEPHENIPEVTDGVPWAYLRAIAVNINPKCQNSDDEGVRELSLTK